MDITLFLVIIIIAIIVGLINWSKSLWAVVSTILLVAIFIFSIVECERNEGIHNQQFEKIDVLPFEWNPSDREYYIYHQDKYLKCETHVEGFDPKLVKEEDYDSCYVYSREIPTFFLFLDTRWWNTDHVYRQSDDILLKNREKKSVKIQSNEK